MSWPRKSPLLEFELKKLKKHGMINDYFCIRVGFREFLFFSSPSSFIIWMMSWWGFHFRTAGTWDRCFFLLLGQQVFSGKYRQRGFIPLWNPGYSGGVPWNFFLRRMGEVNPFYWIINVIKFFSASLQLHAHLIFIVFYYFLGLVGFWLLARLFSKRCA